jgi:hypothetical protein
MRKIGTFEFRTCPDTSTHLARLSRVMSFPLTGPGSTRPFGRRGNPRRLVNGMSSLTTLPHCLGQPHGRRLRRAEDIDARCGHSPVHELELSCSKCKRTRDLELGSRRDDDRVTGGDQRGAASERRLRNPWSRRTGLAGVRVGRGPTLYAWRRLVEAARSNGKGGVLRAPHTSHDDGGSRGQSTPHLRPYDRLGRSVRKG